MSAEVCENEIMDYHCECDAICHTVRRYIFTSTALAINKYNELVSRDIPCSIHIQYPGEFKSVIPEKAVLEWAKDKKKNREKYSTDNWFNKEIWPDTVEIIVDGDV